MIVVSIWMDSELIDFEASTQWLSVRFGAIRDDGIGCCTSRMVWSI